MRLYYVLCSADAKLHSRDFYPKSVQRNSAVRYIIKKTDAFSYVLSTLLHIFETRFQANIYLKIAHLMGKTLGGNSPPRNIIKKTHIISYVSTTLRHIFETRFQTNIYGKIAHLMYKTLGREFPS